MDLYGQDGETRLLCAFAGLLEGPTMIDVGAERGSLAAAMLAAGVSSLHAVEPHPDNARALRERFAGDPRVSVHECALGEADREEVRLHVSQQPGGGAISFGHTLLERADTDEIRWAETLRVRQRSLASMIASGEIPARTGILKVDAEGSDLAIVYGMGPLDADVVMVEHWSELPNGLGRCPWTPEQITAALRDRGFEHFAFILHRGEFITLKWDDAEVECGAMGNLVFIHERVLSRLAPAALECAGALAEQAVAVGRMYMQAANDRLAVINGTWSPD